MGQDFGNASKTQLSRLIFGKQVRIETAGKDRYGRTLGNVFVGLQWVNEAQVRAGVAWAYRHYSKNPTLLEAEAQARSLKRGLWRDTEPVPPWEFRKRKSAAR